MEECFGYRKAHLGQLLQHLVDHDAHILGACRPPLWLPSIVNHVDAALLVLVLDAVERQHREVLEVLIRLPFEGIDSALRLPHKGRMGLCGLHQIALFVSPVTLVLAVLELPECAEES